MSDIKISVIMPVYKVEQYVAKAIESIQKQTMTEWELFMVDDGSPDKSGEICDAYAKKDSRIKVIHKENGGAPSARNVAIEQARGKYMYFMDSDDWAEPDMLEYMYGLAEKHQAQYVVCGYYIDTYYDVAQGKYLSEEIKVDDAVYENKESFRAQAYRYFDRNLLYTPWNKLFLSSYIMEKGLRFPNTLWDDFPFNLSVIRDVERVVVSSRCFYHFIRARVESETASYTPKMYGKREEEHGWMLDLYRYWQMEEHPESREMIQRRYIERLIGCVENITNPKCQLSGLEKKKQLGEMLKNPRVKTALQYANPRSGYMKLMLLPVRLHCVPLLYLEGKVISAVKVKHGRLFAKLKAGR